METSVVLINELCEESDVLMSKIAMLAHVDCRDVNEAAFWDDLSGKQLNADKVKQARIEELGELMKHRVYEKVPIS